MPKHRTEEHKAVVEAIFRTREEALACIRDGMPGLPQPIRPTHYGDSEPPPKRQENLVQDRERFNAFIEKSRGGFCLACSCGHCTVDLDSLLSFGSEHVSVIALDGPPLKSFKSEWGIALLELYAGYGSVYALSADWEEYRKRNQLVIPFTDGGESQQFIGKDIYRYVPGLYWLNYMSDAYCDRMSVDPAAISEQLGARNWQAGTGTLFQLYDHPGDWQKRNTLVEAVIDATPNFFSIRRVAVPQNISKYEYLCGDAGGFDAREWP
jgi:hypothetical protein